MAKKRRKYRSKGSQGQNTWRTILVAIVGLVVWWFSNGGSDMLRTGDVNSDNARVTPAAQESSQGDQNSEDSSDGGLQPLSEDAASDDSGTTDRSASANQGGSQGAAPQSRGPPGMPVIQTGKLPPEAQETIALIYRDGPFPFDRDGITFQNREGYLPDHPRGYYREYTVITPGLSHRGAKRIVAGREGELYYTDDHYESFSWVVEN